MERKRYLVHDPGRSLEAIKVWREQYRDFAAKLKALMDELGAINALRQGFSMGALQFETVPPGGDWVVCKEYYDEPPFYKPNRKTKKGKEISMKLESLKEPDGMKFGKLLGGGEFIIQGNTWGSVSFEQLGDKFIIGVPIGSGEPFIPPDSTELMMSEYWKLKEDAEVI
jgi:hypothetical protein